MADKKRKWKKEMPNRDDDSKEDKADVKKPTAKALREKMYGKKDKKDGE